MAGMYPTTDPHQTRSKGPVVLEQGLLTHRRQTSRTRMAAQPDDGAGTSAPWGLPDVPPNLDPAL